MPLTFRRKNSHDTDIADFLQALEKQPLTDSVVVDVALTAATSIQEFPHGLKRPYRGAFVVGQDGAVAIYPQLPTASSNASQKIALKLASATACNARLVVF